MADDDPRQSGISYSGVKHNHPVDRMFGGQSAPVARFEGHRLDAPELQDLHGRLMSYYEQELDRQGPNRAEQARDEDYYDNDQWSEEDKAILKARGQVPLVYNVISSTVNWVIGTEKRGRADFRVLPRRKDAAKPAERKTQLLKYLSDVNRTPFHRSQSFEDAVKVGVGWLESGAQEEDEGEVVFTRHESWRNMLWDSANTALDIQGGRYVFRSRWLDLDVAASMFPDRAGTLREAAVEADRWGTDGLHGDDAMDAQEEFLDTRGLGGRDAFSYSRRRVRVIEAWYRDPVKLQRIRGGQFSGEIYDEFSLGHHDALVTGEAELAETTAMRMHVALLTAKALLYADVSPYRHNRYPFTPIWCYRRGRDRMPYGMIRGMRDIQEDINKRASKALYILSTNKTIMDEGAVPDLAEYEEEIARPNSIIVKKQGKDLVINAERELAPAHLDLMSRSIQMIQSQSGVTDEALGRTTNATAGIAIQRRQEQAGMATAGIFDSLRYAAQVHGEKELSLIEQFFTEEKSFRITNMRNTPEYITINDGLPENDIVRSKADFVIAEQDWRASMRQAQTEELLALLGQLAPVAPQVALVMLDLIVEGMDIPARDELVRRIRQVTGQRDPDAEEPTPEELEQQKATEEAAALQRAAAEADIAGKQADAALKSANAERAQADAARAGAEVRRILSQVAGTNVQTQRAALDTALAMIAAPPALDVADGVLHEAGYRSRSEDEDDALRAEAQAAEQAEAEQEIAAAEMAAAEQQQAQQQVEGTVQ